MLAGNGLVEAVTLDLDNGSVGAIPVVIVLFRLDNVMSGVVRADHDVGIRVLLGALDQMILDALGSNLVSRVVRTGNEVFVRHAERKQGGK